MKINKALSILMTGVLVMMISCTSNQKKQIAQDEFCNHLQTFVNALEKLDEASMGNDVKALNKAYDNADTDWSKLVSSAENLENVEINESVKAYDKLADKLDKIASKDEITDEDLDDIVSHIGSTSDQMEELLTTVCEVEL